MPFGGMTPPMIHSSGKMKPMMNRIQWPFLTVLTPRKTHQEQVDDSKADV